MRKGVLLPILPVLIEILSQPAFASVTIEGNERPSLAATVTMDDFLSTIGAVKGLAVFITGICTITALITMFINITKLSTSAGNEAMRKKALVSILYSGVALAIFGGATVIVGVFWNVLS